MMLEREDFEAVEAAEKSLDEFINKRSKAKERVNREEEAWKESERRVVEKRRETNRQRWIDFHGHQHRVFLDLAAEHADRRSRLMLEGGHEINEAPGPEAA